MTETTLEEQAAKINKRMYHNRLDQWNLNHHKGWNHIDFFGMGKEKRPPSEVIEEHLRLGHLVTAGYWPTSVRGYHNHVVMWKERKTKVPPLSTTPESKPADHCLPTIHPPNRRSERWYGDARG